MKLTIVANKDDGKHQQELLKAAQKRGLDASIQNISSSDVPGKLSTKLGDAVIWRSSNLDMRSERAAMLGQLKNKFVVSESVFTMPAVIFKYFQQQSLAAQKGTTKWSIPTYRFSSHKKLLGLIKKGELKLPIVAKPNAGAWGKGILLLKTLKDCEAINKIADYVFQGFISNDGDWRVIVVGGFPLGAMKRMAPAGSFLNNISRGASAEVETDQATLQQLFRMATKAASLFNLRFCGVDIIRDQTTGQFYILEVNTAPQWSNEKGFKATTGIDVPQVVIDYILEKANSDKLSLPDLIETYFKKHVEIFSGEAFHFASRLWLWAGDDWSRKILDARKASYIGETEAETRSVIEKIMKSEPQMASVVVNQNKAYRKPAFEKYPQLVVFNRALFKVIFAETIYGIDIRPLIREFISDKEFMDTFRQLINDDDSIRLLSTHAINYFYLLKNYFKDSLNKSSAVLVDPHELLSLLPGYSKLEKDGIIDKQTSVKLKIYLLTHAIIGQSRFYSRRVKGRSFKRVCQEIDRLITDNYFEVSLDNKFEFLVCAALCQYDSGKLAALIGKEAKKSVSWAGNFLVDVVNASSDEPTQHCLRTSEHRNVLFLMSQKPFKMGSDEAITIQTQRKRPIGRLARISLPGKHINRLVARVDSGATRSSIAASDIREAKDGLHFKLMNPDHYLYTGQEFISKDYEIINVKTTTSKRDRRYAVPLEILIDGRSEAVIFTLADREHMLYPVLLGRNFLSGRYKVDTDRQFIHVIKVPRKHGTLKKR